MVRRERERQNTSEKEGTPLRERSDVGKRDADDKGKFCGGRWPEMRQSCARREKGDST